MKVESIIEAPIVHNPYLILVNIRSRYDYRPLILIYKLVRKKSFKLYIKIKLIYSMNININ